MATIYRFIVETKGSGTSVASGGGKASPKAVAKKGRYVSVFGGSKGGVEHNRKLRAINPLLNRATNGYWEKGMRVGRAASGLVTKNTATGALGLSTTAIAILISFAIQTFLKVQGIYSARAEHANAQNFKALENGFGAIHSEFNISVNAFDGRKTFNENR